MKGFAKRLGLLAACVLLVCAMTATASAAPLENCPGSCTHQAAIGTTHYDTLTEAMTSAESGSTVTLLADVAATITADKTVTLDLGGKTLTGNVTLLAGGTVKNGKIVALTGVALQASGNVTIEKNSQLEGCGTAPTLAIADGKARLAGILSGKGPAAVITASGSSELSVLKDATITAEENPAIAFDCAGKLDISDGTIQGKKDLISVHIAEKRETEISITGGKLLSDEGEAIVITADEKSDVPTDFVTGGTYKKAPTAYIPAYCKLQENTDGTCTVISSYTITFQAGGASGTMDPVKVQCGSAYKLPACGFTPASGMEFAGWNIDGKTYAAGASVTPEADITVTAQWKAHSHYGGNATCLKKAVCTGCGNSYGSLGSHKLSYNSGYAADCDSVGMNAHSVCSTCGSCFVNSAAVSASSLSTPALGHSWEKVEGKPATCTEDGLKAHEKCTTCEALRLEGSIVKEEDLLIAADGHTMEEIAASQATCAEPGIQAHEHCTTCDGQFVKGERVEIAEITTALSSHVLSDWICDEHYHWKACVDCEEVFRQSRHADKDADGSCDDCGLPMAGEVAELPAEESGFSWFFLIPMIVAVVIAILLATKKRK